MPGHPVPRSQWVESAETCAACDKRFSFFISKENCPCCGRLFCSTCLSATCELFPMAPPKAVCPDCFRKTEDWRLGQREQQQTSSHGDTVAAAPPPTSSAALEAKVKMYEEQFDAVKSNARQLREENDSLIDLLAAKDISIANLKEELTKADVLISDSAKAAGTLRAQLQDEPHERQSMERRFEEAVQRAATATQASDSMAEQIREHAEAKIASEALVARLEARAQKAEDKYTQSEQEMKELRAAMKAVNAHNAERIDELTARLQSMADANAHLQREYDRKVEVLHLAEQYRTAADEMHDVEVQHLRNYLTYAISTAMKVVEAYGGRQILATKAVYGAGSADAPARQCAINAVDERLNESNSAGQHDKGELSHSVGEAFRPQSEAALTAEPSGASAPKLCTSHGTEIAAAQQEVSSQREVNARLRAELADKERRLSELQRGCIEAATAARAELKGLRRRLSETKLAHAGWRDSCEACLIELQRVIEAAVSPVSVTGSEMSRTSATKSRWARPTIVEEVQYPSVAEVDVRAIAPVPGLEQWEFDTVAEAQRGGEADVLMRIGHQVALNLHLFPDSASLHRWVCMLATVQANYRANPYHNQVHAADVLQGVYALMCSCPDLLAQMTAMEKRAVMFAAAVHDIRHPGRSEMFLKNTFDATYMQYNGLQVLEQMHTATAFHLLATPELDFTRGDMDDAEALQFHGLVAALIGCTFMGRHASLMEQWSCPLQKGEKYDLAVAADRQHVLSLLLHAADVGAQARGLAVAPKWLGIVEEMCAQGDEEAARGLPLSPGSSRNASLERDQLFFIETFVVPLFDLVHQLFPTIESPMRNLRAMHARYCMALQEARAFPPPVQYRKPTEPADSTAEASHAEYLNARQAALRNQEKALEQSMQRLREAAAAVASREKQVEERATAARKVEASFNSHRSDRQEAFSSIDEEELLRATAAVVAREAEVQQRAAEVEKMTAALEEREEIASRLAEQLADVAEKMNGRRRFLHYREARLRQFEAALRGAQGADLLSFNDVPSRMDYTGAKPAAAPASCDRISPASVKMVKLESALEKLTSALRSLQGRSLSPESKRDTWAAACAPESS
ncbi:hypothetical protein LSCM1_04556 [Leishmania martiniquensis]|uniref:Phosphodiesterase n=1 Tax=Leishmania martiniquensis TaxID=1580590 RepID=A0A836HBN3_9TRYP|nr:hypothetical protein LSCM1_04556 [Leishmania martiniquensis]